MDRRDGRDRQKTSVWDHIHRQRQSDVVVALKAIAVVPEVILRVLAAECQLGRLTTLDYVIPDDHLIQHIGFGLVVSGHVKEQHLGVPVERLGQVGIQVERYEAQIIALPTRRVVGHILDHLFGGGQLHVHQLIVLFECGGESAYQRQSGQHRKGEREDGVRARQQCVHREELFRSVAVGVCRSLTRDCTDVCFRDCSHK